jgi:hypothetical protein
MTEREIYWPYKSAYNFEVDEIRLEMYRLLNQFLAEEKLSLLMQEDAWLFHAVDIVGHLFTAECQRILIQAAVVARVKDDNEEESRLKLGKFETTCGTLIEDLKKPDVVVPLNLRESCNKIIHALQFHYDIEKTEDREIINPTVYLYGSRGSKEWKATLEVVDFIKHYINNVV